MGTNPTRTKMYNRDQIIILPIRHARFVARTTLENVIGEPRVALLVVRAGILSKIA